MSANYTRYVHIKVQPTGALTIELDVQLPELLMARVLGVAGKYNGSALTPSLLNTIVNEIAAQLAAFEQKGGKLELRPKTQPDAPESFDPLTRVDAALTPARALALVSELCKLKFGMDRKPKLAAFSIESERWFVRAYTSVEPGQKELAWALVPFEVVLAVLRQWLAEELVLMGVMFRRTHSMSVVGDYGDPEFLLAGYFWAVGDTDGTRPKSS